MEENKTQEQPSVDPKYADDVYNTLIKNGSKPEEMNYTIQHYQQQGMTNAEIFNKMETKAKEINPELGMNFGDYAGDVVQSVGNNILKGLGADAIMNFNILPNQALSEATAELVTGKGFHPIQKYNELKEQHEANKYKPKSTVGQVTGTMAKYVAGTVGAGKFLKGAGLVSSTLKTDMIAGAIADSALYDKEEGHLVGGNVDNGGLADRLINAAEGGIIGFGLNKVVKYIAPKFDNLRAKAKKAKTPEEIAEVKAESQQLAEDITNKAEAEELIEATKGDKVQQAQYIAEQPLDKQRQLIKNIEESEQRQSNLFEEANKEIEPHQMTKQQHRESLQGSHDVDFEDASYIQNNDIKALHNQFSQTLSERGFKQATNESSKDYLSRVTKSYLNKWGAENVPIKIREQKLGKKAGLLKPEFDETGKLISLDMTIGKENVYPLAAFRHELEHVYDAIKGKQTGVNIDTHFSRYGDETTFASDYVHKKQVTKALREGKEVPQEVLDEYADVIPNLDQYTKPSNPHVDEFINQEAINEESLVKLAKETDAVTYCNTIKDQIQAGLKQFEGANTNTVAKEKLTMYEDICKKNKIDMVNSKEVEQIIKNSPVESETSIIMAGALHKAQLELQEEAVGLVKQLPNAQDAVSACDIDKQLIKLIDDIENKRTAIDKIMSGFGKGLKFRQQLDAVNDTLAKTKTFSDVTEYHNKQIVTSLEEKIETVIYKNYAKGTGFKVDAASLADSIKEAIGAKNLNYIPTEAIEQYAKAFTIKMDSLKNSMNAEALEDWLKEEIKTTSKALIGFNKRKEYLSALALADTKELDNLWAIMFKGSGRGVLNTFVKNILSNVSITGVNVTSALNLGFMDDLAVLIGSMGRKDAEQFSLAGHRLSKGITHLTGALKMTGKVLKGEAGYYHGFPTSMDMLPVEAGVYKELDTGTGRMFDVDDETFNNADPIAKAVFSLFNGIGKLNDFTMRSLKASDEGVGYLQYHNHVDAKVAETVQRIYPDASVKELELKAQEFKQDYFNADGSPRDANLLREAREHQLINEITQEEADNSAAMQLSKALQQYKHKVPFANFFLMFTNVGGRMAQICADYNPAYQGIGALVHNTGLHKYIPNEAFNRYHKEMIKGGKAAAKAQGRLAVGIGAWTMGLGFAYSDLITGSVPANPQERSKFKNNWKPFSFKIKHGDSITYVPYKALFPLNYILGSCADLKAGTDRIGYDPSFNNEKLLGAMMGSIISNARDNGIIGQLVDCMEIFKPENLEKPQTLNKAIARTTNAMTPVLGNGLIKNTAGLITQDKYLHETRNILDNWLTMTPGASNHLEKKYDRLGKPRVRTEGAIGLAPTFNNNNLRKELLRLNDKGLALTDIQPLMGGVNLQEFRNQDNETAYEFLQKTLGEVQIDGKTLEQKLLQVVNSAEYKTLQFDGDKRYFEDHTASPRSIKDTEETTKISRLKYYQVEYLEEARAILEDRMTEFKHEQTGNNLEFVDEVADDDSYFDTDVTPQVKEKEPIMDKLSNLIQ